MSSAWGFCLSSNRLTHSQQDVQVTNPALTLVPHSRTAQYLPIHAKSYRPIITFRALLLLAFTKLEFRGGGFSSFFPPA